MLQIGSNGYRRDTIGSGTNKTTKTFGHFSKRSKTQAEVMWRAWRKQMQQNSREAKASFIDLRNVVQQYIKHAEVYYRQKDKTLTGESALRLKPLLSAMAKGGTAAGRGGS
jgi:hypothetical protein